MVKRFFVWVCVLVVSFFCVFVSLIPCGVSAESGGENTRPEEADEDDYVSSNLWNALLGYARGFTDGDSDGIPSREDFFNSTSWQDIISFATGAVGAIFTDQTFENLITNFRALYANIDDSGYVDTEFLHNFFYLGRDGNLYFTDEFIENAQNIGNENLYLQGVAKFPSTFVSDNYTYFYNLSSPQLNSIINNSLSNLPVFVCYYAADTVRYVYPAGHSFYFQSSNYTGCSTYSGFLNRLNSGVYNYDFTLLSDSPMPVNVLTLSTGSSSFLSDSYSSFYVIPPSAVYSFNRYSPKYCFFSPYPITIYTSEAWFNYYLAGGEGAISIDTGYDLYKMIDSGFFDIDWSDQYDQWQNNYLNLLDEVKEGTKTINDISDILSTDISEKLNDIESIANSAEYQVTYLRKILAEVQSISKKLTYSNVVGTVNAASNLLSSIGQALDSLFDSSEGAFNLLDFVSDGLSDTMNSVFPFSLPHDLLLIYELLAVDPQVPQVKFHFDLASLGLVYDYTYVANDFTKLAYITRFFSSVSFVLLLIHLTNKMLKK